MEIKMTRLNAVHAFVAPWGFVADFSVTGGVE